MKNVIIGSLSCLMLLMAAPAVQAQKATPAVTDQTNTAITESLTPDRLIVFAMRGGLEKQGISGGNSLFAGYRSGKVNAESLIKAGISAGKVSPDSINDQKYLNTVDDKLRQYNHDY
ncbi:MAG: hypothetical protein SAK29_24105 [Scytonema sp. PMC 1069.18]|nr:hypothetical protein [Scytonema sp. PMC 1069.18]MEC4886138.1 hypothetical protein [Scytonema sp. PMC 1070.18]